MRLFNVYYPVRTLVLLVGEALILGVVGMVLLVSHGFDLYDSSNSPAKLEQAFRMLFALGLVALVLASVTYFSPGFLPGKNSAVLGVAILAVAIFCWRSAYSWLVCQPFLCERVYVVGTGDRAQRLLN